MPEFATTIRAFSGVVTQVGTTDEVVVSGDNFIAGGVPTLYINGDVMGINTYDDNYIRFNMPLLDHGVHTLTVLNGYIQ